jgi:endonuclease III
MLPEKMQEMLEATVPPEDQFLFHVMLIRHGRHTCFAQRPACNRCPLLDRCPAGQEFMGLAAKETARTARKTVRQP